MDEHASVVIPSCNKKERLKLVLDSFNYQTADRSRFEVIVVDDGSNDGTDAVIEAQAPAYTLRPIRQGRKGRSAARNAGIRSARGPIIILCDDDTIASPEFVSAHLASHREGAAVGVHGRIYNLPYLKFFRDPVGGTMCSADGPARSAPAGLRSLLLTPDYLANRAVIERQKRTSHFERIVAASFARSLRELQWLCCTGGNFSARADVFHRAGLFDENFGTLWGGEDIELGYRFAGLGLAFRFAETAVNYHIDHYRRSPEDELMQSWNYFYRKHPDPILSSLPALLLGEIDDIEGYLTQVNGAFRPDHA